MINNYQRFLDGKNGSNFWRKAKQKEYTTDAINKIHQELTVNLKKLTTRSSITLRYLGFVINLGGDSLKLSNAGETFINSPYKQKILDEQLMKVYLDAPFINNKIAIKVAPMEILLQLLDTVGNITFKEYALFVCWVNEKNELPTVVKLLRGYRNAKDKTPYQDIFAQKAHELGITDFQDNVKRFFDMLSTSSYIEKDKKNNITSNISKKDIKVILNSFSHRDFSDKGYFEYLTTNDGWQFYSSNPNYQKIFDTLQKKSTQEQSDIVEQIVGANQLPKLGDVKPQLVDITISPSLRPKSTGRVKSVIANKIDYAERDANNKIVGDFAEQVVIKYEKENLLTLGKKKFASQVTQVSLESDSYGYDVLSYDSSGKEKHIEVKAVKGKPNSSFRFFISENEIAVAKSDKDYHLYVVFDYVSQTPCIYKMVNPFLNKIPGVTITPVKYQVLVEVKK